MRRSLAKFSESEASNHTPSLADFTTTTPELKFSVHTTDTASSWPINVGIDQCLHFGALQANVTISINFGDTGSKNGSILASIRQKYFRLSVRCSELFVQPVS